MEPEELGIVDAHSHLWISPQAVLGEGAEFLDQEEGINKELVAYRQSGGGAQIDCQPLGAGRDANQLQRLSLSSGVPVIASTGFHLRRYYPEGSKIWEMDIEDSIELFRSEIKEGLIETREGQPVYPGMIKIAIEESLDLSPISLLEAAVRVCQESGLLIQMHTEKGAGLEEVLTFFEGQDLDPDRLVIAHIDKKPDLGLHMELASAGYLLEYDTFFREKYDPEKNLWPLIRKMVDAGHSDSLALATDQADPAMWKTFGTGPGLPGFVNVIKKRLDDNRTV
jgi:phosphotriesterase-related protein